MLEHLCGTIESVSAEMTDMSGKGFSTMALSLRFENKAVGSLVGTYDSSYAYPETHRVEINGLEGRIVIDDTVRRYTFQAAGSETGETWQAGYFNDFDREFHRTFDVYLGEMLDAFRRGNPPPVDASAGRRALLLAHAAIRSHDTGRRIQVTGDDFR
jgi:predicted dehydrogenase